MSISRMTASLAAAHNENTLALANLNFDFSLLRVEVPQEYTGLGAALTKKRRTTAEEGPAHRTARRLGVLFQEYLQPIPELIQAYGRRASEISQQATSRKSKAHKGVNPDNPHDSAGHGAFAGFIGADVTTVWAAATSGPASIAIHLLACLLARLWSGPEATSIWVEIVAERKRILREQGTHGRYNVSLELMAVCEEEITRADLAQWDAGARSWLQVADDVQMRRQKQLMLILNNINLPVNNGGSTYDRVIDAWLTAMNAMEKLIKGQPQRATKGAPLMGFSAWHLYPDLLVLGNAMSSVEFHDAAIPGSAQLTIGLESSQDAEHDGIYWSLSLSHIQYYGEPVRATTYSSRDASRLTFPEVELLALGATLGRWGTDLDSHTGARFFRAIRSTMADGHGSPNIPWLNVLSRASKRFLDAQDDEEKYMKNIIALGRRRGARFLADVQNYPPPLLGLNHPFIMSMVDGSLQHPVNEQLERLLFIAARLGMRPEDLIIRIPQNTHGAEGYNRWYEARLFEYRTATPHVGCLNPEMQGGSQIHWVEKDDPNPDNDTLPELRMKFGPCRCHALGHNCHLGRCHCMQRGIACTPQCHGAIDRANTVCQGCKRATRTSSDPRPSKSTQESLGCTNMPTDAIHYTVHPRLFVQMSYDEALNVPDWRIGVTRPTNNFQMAPRLALRHNPQAGPLCSCYHVPKGQQLVFTLLAGDPKDGIAVFVKVDAKVRSRRQQLYAKLAQLAATPRAGPEDVIDMFETGHVDPQRLGAYLASLSEAGVITIPVFSKDLNPRIYTVTPFIRSLHSLDLAWSVYCDLPGATISPSIMERPLQELNWVPKEKGFWKRDNQNLERAHKFSCIAYFESGTYNVPTLAGLTEIMAVSTRNSIYVSDALLGDPFVAGNGNRISRILGNVGKTGMVMMVAPAAPTIRRYDFSGWRQVSHEDYQGTREDCFSSTSLHLSFTEFEMPFDIGRRGAIDTDILLVETVISVYDREKWVGDLDTLLLYEPSLPKNRRVKRHHPVHRQECSHSTEEKKSPRSLTQIDNWEELLDIPEDLGKVRVGVVRAKDNWLARLATACIAVQKDLRTVILPDEDDICWACCCQQQWGWTRGKPGGDSTGNGDDGEYDGQGYSRDQGNRSGGSFHEENKSYDLRVDPSRTEDPFNVLDESRYDSDDSVCTVEVSLEAEDGYNSLPHLFIY